MCCCSVVAVVFVLVDSNRKRCCGLHAEEGTAEEETVVVEVAKLDEDGKEGVGKEGSKVEMSLRGGRIGVGGSKQS